MRRSKLAVVAVVAALCATLGATSVAAAPDAGSTKTFKYRDNSCC